MFPYEEASRVRTVRACSHLGEVIDCSLAPMSLGPRESKEPALVQGSTEAMAADRRMGIGTWLWRCPTTALHAYNDEYTGLLSRNHSVGRKDAEKENTSGITGRMKIMQRIMMTCCRTDGVWELAMLLGSFGRT